MARKRHTAEEIVAKLRRKIELTDQLLQLCRKDGRILTAREVAQRVHGVGNAQEARTLLELALEGDPDATADERAAAAGLRRSRQARLRVIEGDRAA